MRAVIDNIKAWFTKDTASEGESAKLLIVLRILFTSMSLYGIAGSIYCVCTRNIEAMICYMGTFAIYALMFYSSYYIKTFTLVIVSNVVSVACTITGYFLLGSTVAVQSFFITIVVVCYFSGYGHYIIKGFFALFVCAVYYFLETRYGNIVAFLPFSISERIYIRLMNILTSFWGVATVCYIYSRDSQHLEGKLIEYNKILRQQASTDTLTGLSNRRSANEFIEKLIKRNDEKGFCVCMCDIDFFKKVNDSYGHDVGDKVLAGVAQALVENTSDDCLVSRWGGEEFLIIFPNMNGDEAKLMLDKIRARINMIEFDTGSKTFNITITYGLAEYGYDGSTENVVKEADDKLYIGKENGRDQIVF